ncbi:hypothetical protein [Roseomonas sp. USHLN139]|uniref:hypothetical protein n=1 Tax=Roseomonas sp. USHLN139 TaxID=3081298 RepID=UPI003B01284A
MSLGLTLLLNAAGAALDRLWLSRLGRDAPVVLPDYLDPGLAAPLESAIPGTEARLRDQLLAMGGQMRAIGLPALAGAVLAAPLTDRRRAALLALAGSGRWRERPGGLRWRAAADGGGYLLECRAGPGAAHAPHAMAEQWQQLWHCPEGSEGAAAGRPQAPPCLTRSGGADCLSLEAALRDVVLGLQASGCAELAGHVAGLADRDSRAWLPPAPTLPLPRQARPPAAA